MTRGVFEDVQLLCESQQFVSRHLIPLCVAIDGIITSLAFPPAVYGAQKGGDLWID